MKEKVALNQLATETRNQNTLDLDRLTPRQIARKINAEDLTAARAVQHANKEIGQVMLMAAQAYASKHKIIFMGAAPADAWEFWKPLNVFLLLGRNLPILSALLLAAKKLFSVHKREPKTVPR